MRTPTIPSHPSYGKAGPTNNTNPTPRKLAYETRISQQAVGRHAPPSYDSAPQVATADYNSSTRSTRNSPASQAFKPEVDLASATNPSNPARNSASAHSNKVDDSFSLDSKLQEIRRIQEKEGFAFADKQSSAGETTNSATDELQTGSFLDREKKSNSSDRSSSASTQETIVKIVVNLAFVLAMGIGFIVLVRMWNMARKTSSLGSDREKKQLKVREVLSLGGGVCLHVVDGPRNQFLVAIDSTGIKSVNVMSASFEDSMEMLESGELADQFDDQPETAPTMEQLLGQLASREYQLQETKATRDIEPEPTRVASARTRVRTGSRRSNNAPEEIEQSKELDDKLISMLLKKGKKAA
ncbi:MAG: hypothetical protein AB8B50_19550 [Pirellulaceae bacterium]